MSRKYTNDTPKSPFKRLLGWTIVLALVFSAGLITGERIIRRDSQEPLVDVTDQVVETPEDSAGEDEAEEPTSFAFFDQLSRKATVSLSSTRRAKKSKTDKKVAAKPKNGASEEKDAAKKKKEAAAQKAANAEAAAKKNAAKKKAEAQKDAAKKASAQKDKPAQANADTPARYTLQVAAHPDLDGAKEHMERLRSMGLQPQLVSAAIPGKGTFYRVRVGKFATMDKAHAVQEKLKSKNSLSTFVSPL